jgi:medium-chain acyl-[acyl-carrier-protein] hydrolase
LPPAIEIRPVHLPGREDRFSEAPTVNGDEIVDPVAAALLGMADLPIIIFGHSMGALLAFRTACRLQEADLPALLIVSGKCPPQLTPRAPRLGHLRGAELVRQVAGLYGGIPQEAREDDELVELMARVLEADIRVVESQFHWDNRPLNCPIAAYGGDADPWLTAEELRAWRSHTAGSFSLQQFPGDHFYFRRPDSERQLLDRLCALCLRVADQAGTGTYPDLIG